MFSFIKRVSGFGSKESPAAVQPAVNPEASHLVISESEDCEDGYAQVSMRRMTYAEVAHIGMRSYVQSVKPVRPAASEPKAKMVSSTLSSSESKKRPTVSLAAESDDLYGDLADQVYNPPRKGSRRKSMKRQRPRVRA